MSAGQLAPELEAEFTAICERHRARLVAYCRARVGQAETAEDLCQEALLKAWAALPRYQDRGRPLLAWIYSILHNCVVDYLRDQGKAAVESLDGVKVDDDREYRLADVRLLEARAERDTSICERLDCAAALRRLKPHYREAVLYRAAGLSCAEVAALQHCSENTVKGRLYFGRKALVRALSARTIREAPTHALPGDAAETDTRDATQVSSR